MTTRTDSPLTCFYGWERSRPDAVFLRQPEGRNWHAMSWAEAGNEARRMAAALRARGLEPGDHVGILSKNCRHWILADLAIMMAGLVSVPLYPNLTAEQVREVLRAGDVRCLFVGKLDAWDPDTLDALPELDVIRFPAYPGNAAVPGAFADWEALTGEHEPLAGEPHPPLDATWTILFTSGTTGRPKGAVHSWARVSEQLRVEREQNLLGVGALDNPWFFSYLPLNHVAERLAIEFLALLYGGTISFGESLERFPANLQATQPHLFLAVPRIWTKFQLAILQRLPQKRLDLLMRLPLVSGILRRKLRRGLGLERAITVLTGASMTPDHLKDWYARLGIHLREVYGSTELMGAASAMPADDIRRGSVGRINPVFDARIDPDSGEIQVRVPWVMTGYYQDPELTARVLRDGWYHTGDRGRLSADGFLSVEGRIGDAFKGAKGEFVAPAPIEEALGATPLIEQVCVAGLGLSQPVGLLNLSEIGKGRDRAALTRELEAQRERVNAGLMPHERVSTLVVTETEWSVENGLLTPTLKVRRGAVQDAYGARLGGWHEAPGSVLFEADGGAPSPEGRPNNDA
jgi:long-chain acyl-CoA synthetase